MLVIVYGKSGNQPRQEESTISARWGEVLAGATAKGRKKGTLPTASAVNPNRQASPPYLPQAAGLSKKALLVGAEGFVMLAMGVVGVGLLQCVHPGEGRGGEERDP